MIPAAIIAGGRGERMRPETDHCPKPMLSLAGKPIMEYQLEWLKRSGVTNVFLCLGYKAEVVSGYFGDGKRWGLNLRYSVEKTPRGTAGAVKDLRDWGGEDLLVVYGDVYVDMDLRKFVEFHRARPGDATLVVWNTDHPHDSDLVSMEGDRVTGFYRSKTGEAGGQLALAAVMVLRPSLLALVPSDEPSDFGRDIFPKAVARGRTLRGYVSDEILEDVGTPERRSKFLERWEGRL